MDAAVPLVLIAGLLVVVAAAVGFLAHDLGSALYTEWVRIGRVGAGATWSR
jgi:hypothetical protein